MMAKIKNLQYCRNLKCPAVVGSRCGRKDWCENKEMQK